jgi:hypothetical protein
MQNIQSTQDTAQYNNLMTDLATGGTTEQIAKDAEAFLATAQATPGNPYANTVNAVQNGLNSLSDGTWSRQGTEGAMEGGAAEDGMTGVFAPLIAGAAGSAQQQAGQFDGGSSNVPLGSVGANANILITDMTSGAPPSEIQGNAQALATEASNAGDDDVAQVAQDIASGSDGSCNPYRASLNAQALDAAITQDSGGS